MNPPLVAQLVVEPSRLGAAHRTAALLARCGVRAAAFVDPAAADRWSASERALFSVDRAWRARRGRKEGAR